jgi:hypothetical protein
MSKNHFTYLLNANNQESIRKTFALISSYVYETLNYKNDNQKINNTMIDEFNKYMETKTNPHDTKLKRKLSEESENKPLPGSKEPKKLNGGDENPNLYYGLYSLFSAIVIESMNEFGDGHPVGGLDSWQKPDHPEQIINRSLIKSTKLLFDIKKDFEKITSPEFIESSRLYTVRKIFNENKTQSTISKPLINPIPKITDLPIIPNTMSAPSAGGSELQYYQYKYLKYKTLYVNLLKSMNQ